MKSIQRIGFLFGLLISTVGEASEADLREDVTLNELDRRVRQLEHGWRFDGGTFTAEVTEARFERAMEHWMLGTHRTAAEHFQVLADASSPEHELYPQIEWYLSDSLHRAGLPEHAESSLLRMALDPAHLFHTDAIQTLLLWYAREGSHASYWQLARNISPSILENDRRLSYVLGRSQLILGALDLAEQNLSRLSSDDDFAIRSRYLLGAIELQRQDDLGAEAYFLACLALVATTDRDAEVQDLAHLARGRIEYARGDFVSAATHYGSLQPGSPHLADALYELTWTHVASHDRAAALYTAELLFLQFPQHADISRVELLVGHLHYTGEEWAQADQMFSRIVKHQLPVHQAIQADLASPTTRETPALPEWAEARVSEDAFAARTTDTRREVASSLVDTTAVSNTLTRLQTHLQHLPSAATSAKDASLAATRRLLANQLIEHLAHVSTPAQRIEARRVRRAFALDVERDPSCVTHDRAQRLYAAHGVNTSADERAGVLLRIAARLDRVLSEHQAEQARTREALDGLLRTEQRRVASLQAALQSIEPIADNMAAQARLQALHSLSHDLFETLSEAEARRADIVWRDLSDINHQKEQLALNHSENLYELRAKYETVRSMIE